MAETTTSEAHDHPPDWRHHPLHFWMTPENWGQWAFLILLLAVVGTICFMIGVGSQSYTINDARQQIGRLQKDNQDLRTQVQQHLDKIKTLTDNLAAAQTRLNDVFSSYRTIVLNGNEMTSVASGHFTIGLVGQPANRSVTINANGTQKTATVGDSIDLGTTSCHVKIMSFDMFKVTLLTTCVPVSP